MQRVVLASDQMGFALKQFLIQYLGQKGFQVTDAGTDSPDVVVDYPDYAQKAAFGIVNGLYDWGIVICGTGLGVSIAANKVPGIRAALCTDVFLAHLARAHSNANILAMGAWVVTPQRAVGIVDEFINTPFEGGRHIPRLKKLDQNLLAPPPEIIPAGLQAVRSDFRFGVALSVRKTVFSPVLYPGRLKEGLYAAAEAGLEHVEISIREVEDVDLTDLKKTLFEAGLVVSALATAQGCLHDRLCLAAEETEKRQAAVKRMERIVDFATQLSEGCGVILGGVRGKLEGTRIEMARQRAWGMEGMSACARYAAGKGVPVYIEPINRYETNFINSASDGLAAVEEIGESNVSVLLDTFHMNIEETNLPAAVFAAREHLGYIHFADSNREAPGRGHTDFRAILLELKRMGFAGRITAEILPVPDDEGALHNYSQFLQALFPKSGK